MESRPITVLLIEDHAADRLLTRHQLAESTHTAFELAEAASLAEAVARGIPVPDVILLDLNFPDMTGVTAVEQARVQWPETPILVLTGQEDEGRALAAVKLGAQDYLVKGSLAGDALARVIRQAMERHAAQEVLRASQERLEVMVSARSESLLRANRLLEDEVRKHCATEQDLRDANIRLSDALTELKRAQRCLIQSERMQALGQMAARMMHDFNNALMPVLGYAELILANPDMLDDRIQTIKTLHEIRAGARRAAEEIRHLREFYLPAQNGDRVALDVNRLVAECLERERARAQGVTRGAGGRVGIHAAFGNVPTLLGNESEIEDAIGAILANGLEAMPEGGSLTVTTRPDSDGLALEVRDTGLGMSDATLQRCFEPFFTTKGSFSAGIGLAVAYGVARSHGGRLEVRSRPGEGTVVLLTLASGAGQSEAAASPAGPPPVAAPAAPTRALRILAIDDDAVILRFLERHFQSRGHTVRSADTGEGGLNLSAAEPFDLVVTDRAMPDMSGDDVAARIRQRDGKIPILMLTGFGDLMRDTGTHPFGVSAILSKPVSLVELDRVVASVIEGE